MTHHSATPLAEYADAVGLVDHQCGVVFFFQAHHLFYVGHITLHREYGVAHHELDLVRVTLTKLRLKRGHIVVLVFKIIGERQAATLYDRGMILLIEYDIVLSSGQGAHHTKIHAESCAI